MKKRVSKKTKKPSRSKKRTTRKKTIPKTIKKPANKLPARSPTYIKNFDKLVEGGFKKNSTNLLVGGAGSGKSIFATQFLVGGMKNGEKCLYVTFEEKKDRFGWNLAEYEKKGLFTFLEYTPAKVKTMLEEGGGAIESIIIRKKISRIVIDSITSFELLFKDELEKREAAISLFNMITGWSCTSLLTFEGEPLKDEKIAPRTMEFESDSIILLYYIREKGERHRYLEILKMRGTKHSKKVYRFHIDKDGTILETRPTSIKNLGDYG
jgi:circadian clock protein KaiC